MEDDNLEKLCADKNAWICYDTTEYLGEEIYLYSRCPKCGKYIKQGELLTNMAGDVKLTGWICKVHGEIEPFWLIQ